MNAAHPVQGLLRRLSTLSRPPVRLTIDGVSVEAKAGDTLLVAMLAVGDRLRMNESDGQPRAGFCMMGACQDCWVTTETGGRLRACSAPVRDGLNIRTDGSPWPGR